MNWDSLRQARLALISTLSYRSPNGHLGRTALMKFCYFLQTVKGIPLGYDFTLYSYGPFDSDVLSDLNFAETIGAVESQVVFYPGGYGYEIKAGKLREALEKSNHDFLSRYEDSIEWVLEEFGELGSAELELLGTIIFVDREASHKHENMQLTELVQRVRDVKPRFQNSYIEQKAQWLISKRLLSHIHDDESVHK
jgi:uncharacterized protein